MHFGTWASLSAENSSCFPLFHFLWFIFLAKEIWRQIFPAAPERVGKDVIKVMWSILSCTHHSQPVPKPELCLTPKLWSVSFLRRYLADTAVAPPYALHALSASACKGKRLYEQTLVLLTCAMTYCCSDYDIIILPCSWAWRVCLTE